MIAEPMMLVSARRTAVDARRDGSATYRQVRPATPPPLPPTAARPAEVTESPREAEARLIDRVRSGDEQAARDLVDLLYPTVLRSVRAHRPRRTSEEDLIQTILMRVFTHLEQFSGQVPIQHWVSRIAVNTCLNQLKHEIIRPELRMSDLREEEEAVIRTLAASTEDLPTSQGAVAREVLDKLMARLRPEERLVITLLHLEERSTEEISALTGWSVPAVKVKAFRARVRMRTLWQTFYKDEPL